MNSIDKVLHQLARPLQWLREEGRRGELARGASSAFLIRLAGMGTAFLVQILIARFAGVSGFGEYVYVMSWLLLLSLLSRIGLDAASLRFVAAYNATADWERLRGFVVQAHRLTLVASLTVSGLVAAVLFLLYGRLSPTLTQAAWIGCAALPVLGVLHVQSATLRGLRAIVASLVPLELVRPVALGVAVTVGYKLSGSPLTAPSVMATHLLALALALVITMAMVRVHLPAPVWHVNSVTRRSQWLSASLPMLLISVMQLAMVQTDVLMLGAFAGTDQAGLYSAASRIAQIMPFGLVAVNAVVAPTISELWEQQKRQELQRVLTVAAQVVAAVTVTLGLFIGSLGGVALSLFGAEFTTARPALLILIAGQCVLAVSGSVGVVMTMAGLEKLAASIASGVAMLNVGLNALLIPAYGAEGAAVATASAIAIWNGAMLVVVARSRHLNASVFPFALDPKS